MNKDDEFNVDSAIRFSRLTPSPQSSHISVNDSESDSSQHAFTITRSPDQEAAEDNNDNSNSNNSGVPGESNTNDEATRLELKKLGLDQNGTFMADFDPEKSQREMRKMNRRIYSKESKKNQLYDDKGVLLESSLDLCDCLEKTCIGCHFPCPRCGSHKCGSDCRCNRKYIVDFIKVEGTEIVYNFPT